MEDQQLLDNLQLLKDAVPTLDWTYTDDVFLGVLGDLPEDEAPMVLVIGNDFISETPKRFIIDVEVAGWMFFQDSEIATFQGTTIEACLDALTYYVASIAHKMLANSREWSAASAALLEGREVKEFGVGAILSLVSEAPAIDIEGAVKLLEFLGVPVTDIGEARVRLLKQHPMLPTGRIEFESADEHSFWLAHQRSIFGDTLPIVKL